MEALLEHGTPEEVWDRCWDDPYEFAKIFLREMFIDKKTGYEFPPAALHEELYRISRDVVLRNAPFDKKRGFAAAAPRGFSKSTIVSFILVIWAVVMEHKGLVVIFSDTDAQAELIGANIRKEFEENQLLRLYFGNMCGNQPERRLALKWTLQDFTVVKLDPESGKRLYTARIKVRGCGASMRGIRVGAQRPDLIILDDGENDEDVQNKELREKLYNSWWYGAVIPMLDPLHGSVIVIGTILHFDSLLSRLLKKTDDYETRRWTCYDEYGNSMWEERFTKAALESQQRENPVAFAREMLNDPREDATRKFRAEDARFYYSSEVEYDGNGGWTFRGEPLSIFSAVDPAIDEKEESCQFALITGGVTKSRQDIVILRVLMLRISFPEQLQAVEDEARTFHPLRFGFETAAYQRSLPQMSKKKLKSLLNVKELKHGSGEVSKRRRIIAITPLAANGHFWLRAAEADEEGEYDELNRVRVHADQYPLYHQMMEWPLSDLDDGVDCLASLVETVGGDLLFAPGTFTAGDGSLDLKLGVSQEPLYKQLVA